MTGVYPSAPLQDQEWDLAPGSRLVALVVAIGGHSPWPEALALFGRGDTRVNAAPLRPDLHRRVGIGAQVVVPGGVLGVAALGGDDHDVVAVLDVEQCRGALG